MPRDAGLCLEDMIEAARRIQEYTGGLDRTSFGADPRTIDAVMRNLSILGEAAKSDPEHVRRMAPTIDWRKIAGMRDLLVHAYFHVDLDIVWDVAKNRVPGLEPPIRRLLEQLAGNGT